MAALIRGEPPKKEEPSGEEGGEEAPNAANGTEKMDTEDGMALLVNKKKKESNEHKKRSRSRSRHNTMSCGVMDDWKHWIIPRLRSTSAAIPSISDISAPTSLFLQSSSRSRSRTREKDKEKKKRRRSSSRDHKKKSRSRERRRRSRSRERRRRSPSWSRPRVLDHRDRRGFSPPWRRSPPRGPRLPGPERRDV
ncbi:unnamed protein product [Onchocerca flexuosa]|uniref:Arginine/serine-rich coiled-coil protein 2 n=1 Tax=Onchocerca flexuosa TaxID=387005 RepID=A0A183I6I2_9BILA|nr:unnamed protein product [Onchocerca flexuosa]